MSGPLARPESHTQRGPDHTADPDPFRSSHEGTEHRAEYGAYYGADRDTHSAPDPHPEHTAYEAPVAGEFIMLKPMPTDLYRNQWLTLLLLEKAMCFLISCLPSRRCHLRFVIPGFKVASSHRRISHRGDLPDP
jgi:hypothetical protein